MQRKIKLFKFIKPKPKVSLQNLRPAVFIPIKLPPKAYEEDVVYSLVKPLKNIFPPKAKHVIFLENLIKRYPVLKALIEAVKEEQRYGAFFLLASLFAAAGAVLYFWLSYEIVFKTILAAAGITIAFAYLLRKVNYAASVFLLLLALVSGIGAAKLEDMRYSTPMLAKNTMTHISAKVLFIEKQAASKYRLLLKLDDTWQPHLKNPPYIVRLSARAIPEMLNIGDNIEGQVFLRALSGPVRPDNYDFAFYNYFQAIGAQGFFLRIPQLHKSSIQPNLVERLTIKVAKIRFLLAQHIKKEAPDENGAIAAALIAGTHGGISQDTNDALRMAGLAHILAISGLHMSMITGLVFFAVRSVLAFFMSFASYFSIKKISAAIALVCASFYFMLSGASPSAQRSFIMVSIIFLAIMLDRRAITLRNLSIAMWAAVIIYPHQLLDPSFQMSFSAAGALIAVYGFYTRWKSNETLGYIAQGGASVWLAGFLYFKNMWAALFTAAGSSLVAGAASGIFAAYHFGNTAPFGVISNALVFPVITFIVMPFAVITVLAMFWHLEAWPLFIMCRGIVMLKAIAFWVVSFSPHIQVKYISSSALAVLSIGFCILVALRTRLRIIGAFIMVAGFLMYYCEPSPIVLISENGKMVAVLGEDNSLALAYKRPSNFTLNNWKKAFGKTNILLPVDKMDKNYGQNFVCNPDFCVKNIFNGEKIYVASSDRGKLTALQDRSHAKIIFLNYDNYDIAPQNIVKSVDAVIITKRDLALRGSVEIFKDHKMVWAVDSPVRSWNSYRLLAKTYD